MNPVILRNGASLVAQSTLYATAIAATATGIYVGAAKIKQARANKETNPSLPPTLQTDKFYKQ